MTSAAGFWICIGLFLLGLCLDNCLNNIARAISGEIFKAGDDDETE